MYRSTALATIAALLLSGCSGANDSPDVVSEAARSAGSAVTPTASAPVPAVSEDSVPGGMNHHAMSGMDGEEMAAMDHRSMPGGHGGGEMNHPDAAARAQGMAGMRHTAAQGAQPNMGAGMDHGGMNMEQHRPRPAGAMAGMDHTRMAGMKDQRNAAAGAHGVATMNHAEMAGHADGGRKRSQGMPAMDHKGMPAMDHKGMTMSGAQRMDHGTMPALQSGVVAGVPVTDAGMEKLRILVAELVQDPAVQARIQEDPALRRLWADEGVRRNLLNFQ